ncbi:MAG: NADH-quinone oxidoreductase subunit A [Coriobacteriia bacterium]|nr:NADH-quinone oxidoreductase subunit A [Coriobacteriia bacterium]
MLNDLLLTPPVVFVLLLVVVGVVSLAARALQTRSNPTGSKGDPYACGQEVATGRFQPGYDFFHIAFAFTILEVTALLIGTVTANAIWLIAIIFAIIVLALVILFRKD